MNTVIKGEKLFSKKGIDSISRSSVIREMFEKGARLAAAQGAEKVFDFSLGNPYLEPPEEVRASLERHIKTQGLHRYMPNGGFADVREQIACHVSAQGGQKLSRKQVMMTCGAAGGLNAIFKSILNPLEEIIVFAPYFGEYAFYVGNYQGVLKVVDTCESGFIPLKKQLKEALGPRTKGVLINSPNNPTGVLYSGKVLADIAEVLKDREKETGQTIFLISDEPYTAIVYDGHSVPSVFDYYRNSIVVTSFSKSLGLAGERIGYVALHPELTEGELLMDLLTLHNRTLGFVNAPAIWQKVVGECIAHPVDVRGYQQKRDLLYAKLTDLGFELRKPEGAFYLFPRSPEEDETFVEKALEENILIVPGAGFGAPGFFRISYCVPLEVIENSLPRWEALARCCRLI